MLKFLTLKPDTFGLDISDLSLKIIKLEKRGRFFDLASFGEEKIKPGIVKEGKIKNEKALTKIIKEAIAKVKGKKLGTKYLVASLPEEKSFLQVIQMPRMSEEDLKSAVIYEAENYIPLPIDQVYLDSQIVPPVYNHLDHLDVLIAALPKETVDPYVSCFKKANLKPVSLEIESLAIARALIKKEVTASPFLLIDLGETRSGFIVFSGHSLRFTSSIPVSAQNFTEIISKVLGVNLAEAERLKIENGLQSKGKKGKEIFEALIPALTDLIEQIKRHLAYYQTHASHEHLPPNGKGIKKVFLCGGGANLKGLPEFLATALKIPVELGNPWINILADPQKGLKELPLDKSLRYTTALGLALRGVKKHD
jgi:type IV pilus assembly protein PilM